MVVLMEVVLIIVATLNENLMNMGELGIRTRKHLPMTGPEVLNEVRMI